MAQNPIGTITDEERLVPLLGGDEGFYVDVTDPVRTADVPEEGPVAWEIQDAGSVPELALAPLADADVDADTTGSEQVRELSGDGDALTVDLPTPFVTDALGLDADDYDEDNPLLFEPDEITDGIAVPTGPDGDPAGSVERAIELTPVRFADGTPYRDVPQSEATLDSDPVAEAELERERGEDWTPQSGTVSAPVDGPVIDEVLSETDADRNAVVDALETISRRDLVSEADDESAADPVVADDRVVVALDPDTWNEKIAAQLSVDERSLDAVREIHARQAAALLGSDDRSERFAERVPVVVEHGRLYESDEPPE